MPKISRLLSAGKTHEDVIEEVSRKGFSIKESQLQYRLGRLGRRTHLTGQAGRYTSYMVQKRARNKKKSAVFFNGHLIPSAKVFKETRRHDRPTLLPVSGGSPKRPEDLDLVICTPASLADSPTSNGLPQVQHSLPDHGTQLSSLPWLIFFLGLKKDPVLPSIRLRNGILDFTRFTIPAPPQFPGTLMELCEMKRTLFGVRELDRPYMAC